MACGDHLASIRLGTFARLPLTPRLRRSSRAAREPELGLSHAGATEPEPALTQGECTASRANRGGRRGGAHARPPSPAPRRSRRPGGQVLVRSAPVQGFRPSAARGVAADVAGRAAMRPHRRRTASRDHIAAAVPSKRGQARSAGRVRAPRRRGGRQRHRTRLRSVRYSDAATGRRRRAHAKRHRPPGYSAGRGDSISGGRRKAPLAPPDSPSKRPSWGLTNPDGVALGRKPGRLESGAPSRA